MVVAVGEPLVFEFADHRARARSRLNDIFRQKEQFDISGDQEFCLRLAKKTVCCKILNQRTVLRNYNRRAQLDSVAELYKKIKYLTEKINRAETVEVLMGYEGSIARSYFQALGQLVPTEFHFSARTRRPRTPG